MNVNNLSYKERAAYCLSPFAKKLLNLMDTKHTNLALSADVIHAQQLLELANTIGPEICILKTHIDIIEDYTPALTQQLKEIAKQHEFFIFEDRKFADIGNTVKHQYAGGVYKIANWAHIVNAHSLPGPTMLQGLAEIARKKNHAIILIAELSSMDNLINQNYVEQTLKIAEQFADIVIGFISQGTISNDPHWITFTPGVKFQTKSDGLGQQYHTPEKTILDKGSDVIIVGRGIVQADHPVKEAQKYRAQGWASYLKRCQL